MIRNAWHISGGAWKNQQCSVLVAWFSLMMSKHDEAGLASLILDCVR